MTVPQPSALQTHLTTIAPSTEHPSHLLHLTAQVLHNLQHQHQWTSLQIHTHGPGSDIPLSRPLISGTPPTRLYIHPDEQIALLQAQKKAGGVGLGDVKAEREWVLPSQLREKWTLRHFGDVFEGIGTVPPADQDEDEDEEGEEENQWRAQKRVLLAVVDDDSTVVYYIVHDGIVKPRQN